MSIICNIHLNSICIINHWLVFLRFDSLFILVFIIFVAFFGLIFRFFLIFAFLWVFFRLLRGCRRRIFLGVFVLRVVDLRGFKRGVGVGFDETLRRGVFGRGILLEIILWFFSFFGFYFNFWGVWLFFCYFYFWGMSQT